MSALEKRGRFTPFTLDNAWIIDFPAEPGGVLRLAPGHVHLSARLSVCDRDEENWYCVLECDVRLADGEGRLWQATSHFHASELLYPLIDFSRKQPARWLRKGPAEWREALKRRRLAQELATTYDDRFYRCFWIDGTAIPIQFKYLGAEFELAALSADRLVVSVQQVFGCWNAMPLEGPDGSPLPLPPSRPPRTKEEEEAEMERLLKEGEDGDYDQLPTLAYEIDAGKLLLLDGAAKNEEGWFTLPVPRPLVFRRVRGRAEAQPGVTFLPGKQPTPLAPVAEPTPQTFVPLEWKPEEAFDLLTDAGGWLRVDGSKQAWQVSLDRQPGSAGEPVDVLCWRSRLADSSGDLWEGASLFTPEAFFEGLGHLDRIEWPRFVGPGEEGAPAPGERRPGLEGIRGLLDDGAWRYLFLANEVIAFAGNRQQFRVDVEIREADLWVCISGLVGRRRPIEVEYDIPYVVLDPAKRAAEVAGWDQDRPLPPLGYLLDFRKLAFRNTSFAVDDGFWHKNAIPIPVVFRRVGRADPAPGARFVLGPL